ncbi:hypothetical protein [Enhygromyxa salina]|uniref:Uncharacterized protein n=1 Tax=Enhygromyxa salina TaxID=215803 RepID=A0A2S9YUY9_9BACT|nr:hypothetical protein [Enhygromyxa salina]PRQ08921.1 hypothetical protein ENSA7_13200 [Enhygromyxa salina]
MSRVLEQAMPKSVLLLAALVAITGAYMGTVAILQGGWISAPLLFMATTICLFEWHQLRGRSSDAAEVADQMLMQVLAWMIILMTMRYN